MQQSERASPKKHIAKLFVQAMFVDQVWIHIIDRCFRQLLRQGGKFTVVVADDRTKYVAEALTIERTKLQLGSFEICR